MFDQRQKAGTSKGHHSRTLAAFAAFALASACSSENGGNAIAAQSKGGGDSELQTTLADPAPMGALALTEEVLAEGLVNPWCITFLPGGDLLVTERPGRVRLIKDGVLQEAPIAGVPEVVAWNQGGLFDILLHPAFEENQTIFLSYAHGTRKANATRLARAKFDGEKISDLVPLYDAVPEKDTGHHFGGRLVWGPDDMIYLSLGEGSRYKEKAQDMSSSFGAVVRISPDGSIPDDNPTFGDGDRPELWSKGHRNPQGLTYDADRGVLWEHEHGARGGDEINIVEPGNNYGWPIATYGIDYNGARISPFTEYDGTKQPYKYWTPSIAPSGLAVYRGELFPEDWDGDLLVGGLVTQSLHRVDLNGMSEVKEERYFTGERIRDVRVGPDGAVYVATEDRSGEPIGRIVRLTPTE
ncbi:MAG: PQQ-dependent sugar dehydrogenase [Pseudomonadota bacterium]